MAAHTRHVFVQRAGRRQAGALAGLAGCTGRGATAAVGGAAKVSLSGDWPSTLAPLDLLPGLFERTRKVRSLPVVSRPQQRLLAACLVLAAVWGGLWLNKQWAQAQLWRSQVIAVTGEQASPGTPRRPSSACAKVNYNSNCVHDSLKTCRRRCRHGCVTIPAGTCKRYVSTASVGTCGWRVTAVRRHGATWRQLPGPPFRCRTAK